MATSTIASAVLPVNDVALHTGTVCSRIIAVLLRCTAVLHGTVLANTDQSPLESLPGTSSRESCVLSRRTARGHKIYYAEYDGIRESLAFATGFIFLSQTRQIGGNAGKNMDLEGCFVPVYTQ